MIKQKVVFVTKKQMKNISGKDYGGYSAYRRNKIYIRQDLSHKEKVRTLGHEAGHYIFRKKKVVISKKVVNELRKSPEYQKLKKHGYKIKKIPEEIMVEKHMQIEFGDKKQLQNLKEKYPNAYEKYKQIFKKK